MDNRSCGVLITAQATERAEGEKFPSRAVLVFVKDGEDKVPRNLADQCAEVWEKCGFIDYANDPTVPVREKTTSWFRARRTEAGEESGEC